MGVTVRIKRHIDSETLHLPELRDMIGRDVEIEIRELPPPLAAGERYPLRGSVKRYDDPFDSASDDWEATE